MSTESQLAERPQSVKDYLALPAYKARFGEVLGQRAPQFMASLVAIASQPNLANCEPRSVIASAMIAATLDLPIEKSLGFAHVVPYGGVAQFQMAAKGYVQLALRSGQYHRINAKPINAEAFVGYDEVGEPNIDWAQLDETKPTIGYVVAWKLVNGFTKIAYWPKAKVEAHAMQFSQAYKKRKMDSPWCTNFDKMAIKTVVMNELRAWGILSVQMQTAMRHDMGTQKDVDAEVEYVDGDTVDIAPEVPKPEVSRPLPPARAKKGVAAVQENAKPESKTAAPIEAVTTVVSEAQGVAIAVKPKADSTPTPAEATPATQRNVLRAFLKDKEELIAVCTVEKVAAITIKSKGVLTPSVEASVRGEFVGTVMHIGGATADPNSDDLVANAEWKVGGVVTLALLGKLNTAGKVIAAVQKITVTEATPENPAMEVD